MSWSAEGTGSPGTVPGGDRGPPDPVLIDRVYSQLRAMAQRQVSLERPGHTLQATALVHEAYLRLAEAGIAWSSPGAFYHAAAEAMRRILIEHARRHDREQVGGLLAGACGDGPRQRDPLLDGFHLDLAHVEQVFGGLEDGLELDAFKAIPGWS